MKNRRIDYILFSFLVLFTIFVVRNIKTQQYLRSESITESQYIEIGFEIGQKTTIRSLYLGGYLPDTIYVDVFLFDDMKKYYTKKLNN